MKVAIVTGGTRGIGKSITTELYNDGYQVIAVYGSNDAKALELQEQFPGLDICKCDISDSKAVQRMVTKIFRTYGQIDCLVNNAGIIRDGYFLMMSEEKWMDVVNINLMGLVNMMRKLLQLLERSIRTKR